MTYYDRLYPASKRNGEMRDRPQYSESFIFTFCSKLFFWNIFSFNSCNHQKHSVQLYFLSRKLKGNSNQNQNSKLFKFGSFFICWISTEMTFLFERISNQLQMLLPKFSFFHIGSQSLSISFILQILPNPEFRPDHRIQNIFGFNSRNILLPFLKRLFFHRNYFFRP